MAQAFPKIYYLAMIRSKGSRKKKIPPSDREKTIALIRRNRKKYDNGERLKLKKIINGAKDHMMKEKDPEKKRQWAIFASEFNKELLAL